MASQAAEKTMPQTNSMQREPSMEEILASIRRIIEDSDQAKKPELDVVEGKGPDSPAPEEETPTEPVAAERVEIRPVHEAPAAASALETREAARAMTMRADVADAAAPLQPVVEEEPMAESLRAAMEDEIEASLPPRAANAPGAFEDFEPARLDQRPAIISERTGRQVAAAFEELSDAFAASRRKSFDEIAEEMMRPMLQDWLDNNLPTLVERLVREEIERVARGAAR